MSDALRHASFYQPARPTGISKFIDFVRKPRVLSTCAFPLHQCRLVEFIVPQQQEVCSLRTETVVVRSLRILDTCKVGQTISLEVLRGSGKQTLDLTLDESPPPNEPKPIKLQPSFRSGPQYGGPQYGGPQYGDEYEYDTEPY